VTATAPAISVSKLTKKYGELEAVRGIDFEAAAGETFGFLGPNGAGKSTTIKILCTLADPTTGSARVAGHDVVRERDTVRRNIGLVFQDTTLDSYLTGEQNLRFHADLYGVPKQALSPGITWGDWAVPVGLSIGIVAVMGALMLGVAIAEVPQDRVRGPVKIKGDAGWLRGQTTRRRDHRRSDGGPERRQWRPDGGPGHRYECYTETPPSVSRPNYNRVSGLALSWRSLADSELRLIPF
jgi:ABC-type oligopeptide transport system ATPase subunit